MFSLGKRITELRLKKGMTQVDLAKGLCTPSMISQIEGDKARPSHKVLFRIADCLGVTMEQLLTDVELDLEPKSQWALARALIASKEYRVALPLLQELEADAEGVIPVVKLQLHLAECYLHTDQFEQTEMLLDELRDTATLQGDFYLLAQVQQLRGLIYYRRKSYQVAVYTWQNALEALKQSPIPDDLFKGELFWHLGQASSKVGRMQEAIEFYTESAVCYENSENLHQLAHVYIEMAQACKLLGKYDLAIDYSDQARSIFQALDEYLTTLLLKVQVAVNLGKIGREEEAVALISALIPEFHKLGQHELEGTCHAELAKLYFQKGDLEKVEEACALARELLPELHPSIADLLCIRGRMARQSGEMEKALRLMKQAADCYKNAETFSEWEVVMIEMAHMYADMWDLPQAVAHFDQARKQVRDVLADKGIVY